MTKRSLALAAVTLLVASCTPPEKSAATTSPAQRSPVPVASVNHATPNSSAEAPTVATPTSTKPGQHQFADSPLTALANRFVTLTNGALRGEILRDTGIPLSREPDPEHLIGYRQSAPLPQSIRYPAFIIEISAFVTSPDGKHTTQVDLVPILTRHGLKVAMLQLHHNPRRIPTVVDADDLPKWLVPVHGTLLHLNERAREEDHTLLVGPDDLGNVGSRPVIQKLLGKLNTSPKPLAEFAGIAVATSRVRYNLDDILLMGLDESDRLWKFKLDLDTKRDVSGKETIVFDSRPLVRARLMEPSPVQPVSSSLP